VTGRAGTVLAESSLSSLTCLGVQPKMIHQMADSSSLIGQIISHYSVVEKIGAGGMGVVYKAEDTELRRIIALKFLPEQDGSDPKAREQLRREARTASSLNHPNICAIYEVGEQSGKAFIAMEYVEGKSLSKLIRPGGLPVETVVRYGTQIASALEHAHNHGVIHRDLKPLNVIVTPQGDAKILDFGLARQADPAEFDKKTLETVSTAGATGLSGTFPYMAPEQFEGSRASPRTDIWSLGVVLYEMVAGSRPFHGENLYRLCTSIVRDAPPPLPPHTPPGLASVIRRCLEKEFARRYHSAGEVRAALEALVPSSQSGVTSSRTKSSRSMRAALAVAAILLLALVGFFAFRNGWFGKHGGDSLMPSRVLLGVLSLPSNGDAAQSAFENGLADTLDSRLGNLSAGNRLAVIPTSEMRDKHVTTIEAARKQFGVNLVLVLSVQRASDRARVNYALVDASSLQQLRSGTITAAANDPFTLQDRVFEGVASAMRLQLAPQEKQSPTAHGTLQPAAYDFYLQGRGYLQDYVKPENVDAAIQVFNHALEKDPAFAAANAGLGEAYWSKYQLTHDKQWADAAVQNCQKAAERDAALASAYICLGRVFIGTGEYKSALEQYHRAVELEPASDTAQAGLAYAYEHLDRLADAEKTYRQAIAMHPNYWATYNWLGLFYQRHARYEDARAMYSQVVSLAPDSFTGYSNLGGVCVLQGRYAEAIPILQQSLGIRPTAEASSNLGTAYFQMRRYPEAAVQFEEAVKLDENEYQMWGNLGDAYYWSPGKHSEALNAYGKAIALGEEKLRVNPRDSELLSYLAMYHAMRLERKPALENLDAALRLNPRGPDLLFTAGIVYQQLGDATRALDSLEKAVARGISPATLSDTPNFDTLRSDPNFLKLIQR
jgi:serine/threonine protein kinase/tetratricopeptide (TPR) repeat protein